MRLGILFEKMGGVDLGIDLRGRERSVAEQFLNGEQVGARGEEMGGEGMAQRMRRRRIGKAKRTAQSGDQQLNIAGIERATLHTAEHRRLDIERKGAKLQIGID